MKKIIFGFIILFFISCVSKNECDLERQKAYDQGYEKGFIDGQKNGVQQSLELMHQSTNDYIEKLKNK